MHSWDFVKTRNSLILSSIIAVALVSSVFAYSQIDTTQASIEPEGFTLTGFTTWTVLDEYGNVKSFSQQDNLVVDLGIDTVGDLMFPDINLNGNATDNQFSFIRIGIGTTAPVAGNTGIETPVVGCSAVQDNLVTATSAVSGEITVTVNATFTGASGCVGSFTESVLANDGTGGEILSRQVFSPKVVAAPDTLVGTWEITVT